METQQIERYVSYNKFITANFNNGYQNNLHSNYVCKQIATDVY